MFPAVHTGSEPLQTGVVLWLTQRFDDAVDGVNNAVSRHQVGVHHRNLVDIDGVVPLVQRENRING